MDKENNMNICKGRGYLSESEDSSFGNESDSVFDQNSGARTTTLDKNTIIPFNFTRYFQYEPELSHVVTDLDVVHETKLLGLIVTSNCRW